MLSHAFTMGSGSLPCTQGTEWWLRAQFLSQHCLFKIWEHVIDFSLSPTRYTFCGEKEPNSLVCYSKYINWCLSRRRVSQYYQTSRWMDFFLLVCALVFLTIFSLTLYCHMSYNDAPVPWPKQSSKKATGSQGCVLTTHHGSAFPITPFTPKTPQWEKM